MLEAIKQGKGKIYKWAMIILIVLNGATFTLTQTGCGFLQAAQESANATRADLDGVNLKIAEVLERVEESKAAYERKMEEIAAAEEAGDLEKADLLRAQAMAILDGGKELWNIYEDTRVEQEQLKTAYDNAVKRVEQAATKEEQWGSIFGTVLQTGLSLFGLGGVGGGIAGFAASRNSRREADAYKSEADDYRGGLEVTSKLLDKAKAMDPEKWKSFDKTPIIAKASPSAHDKVKEVRGKI